MVSKKAQQRSRRRRVANVFGAIGYFWLTLGWLFAAILFVPALITAVDPLIESQPRTEPVITVNTEPAGEVGSAALVVFAIILTVAMIGLTFTFMLKLPAAVARGGKTAVAKSSAALTTGVIKAAHARNTKRRRLQLTPRIAVFVKLAALLLPIGAAALSAALPAPALDPAIAVYLVTCLAVLALGAFVVQYSLAHLLKVKPVELW